MTEAATIPTTTKLSSLAKVSDLVPNSGVCALIEQTQIALFYLPETTEKVFAVSNWDPIGKANVLSRGILGTIDDQRVVASPLYKHHFCLQTGVCIEDAEVALPVYAVKLENDTVYLLPQS